LVQAIDEVAAATPFAVPAMASHITHPDPLSLFPTGYTGSHDFDFSNYFMAGNAWKSESWKTAFNRESIGVANSTGFDTNSNLPKDRLDNCPLNNLQLARFRYLHCIIGSIHRCHFGFAFLLFALRITAKLHLVLKVAVALFNDCRDALVASRWRYDSSASLVFGRY
jgi:hypothetical protein